MDRREMARHLDAWIATSYSHSRVDRRLPKGRNALKSYIVESDNSNASRDRNALEELFLENPSSLRADIQQTKDPTLFQLHFPKRGVSFYLDTLDPRFWILHTIAPADDADGTLRLLVQRTPYLDSAWIPTECMEEWSVELGSPRAVTLKFSMPMGPYLDVRPDEDLSDESLILRFSTLGDFRPRLESFRESQALAPSLSTWAIRVTRHDSERDLVVHDDVTSGGKLTCRGNSFSLHSEIVLALKARYAELIQRWEQTYRLRWQATESGVRPIGQVAELALPNALDASSSESLLETLFSGGEPYRLYGIPVRDGDQRYVVNGVDLHNGDRIDFELLPDVLRVYLQANTCGNVLARLLTNMQRYHDARVTLR
jgi:hypothetical protein